MYMNTAKLFIIAIIILIFIIMKPFETNEEYFESNVNSIPIQRKTNKNNKINDELQTEFIYNGKKIIDDALFSDVVMYNSDDVIDGTMGIEKCMTGCKGVCVEYGITGDAFCYPYDDSNVMAKYKKHLIDMSQPKSEEHKIEGYTN